MFSALDPTTDIARLANTGTRIEEARKLQWRDISSTRNSPARHDQVLTVRGKTGARETVCNIGVDRFLAELKSFRTTELGRIPSDDEHLFCSRDGKPIGSLKVGFNGVLKEAGVLFGSDRKRRVPYSLRHTYATMRISEGVNIFQLAATWGHRSK